MVANIVRLARRQSIKPVANARKDLGHIRIMSGVQIVEPPTARTEPALFVMKNALFTLKVAAPLVTDF